VKRLYWGIGTSLVLHLLFLWLVPGFPPIETDSQARDSVKIRIHSTSPESTEKPPPKPRPQNETEAEETRVSEEPVTPPEPSPPENPEKTSEQTKQQTDISEQTDKQPPQSSTNQPEEVKQTASLPSSGNVEPTQRDGEQPAGEKQNQSNEKPLLTRSAQFGDPSGFKQTEPTGPSTASTSFANEPTPKYRVIEEQTNTEIEDIALEPPQIIQESPTPTVENLNFTVETKGAQGQLTMQDWALPATDTDAPVTTREILHRPLPQVPEWLEREGEDVRVSVRYSIDENGRISTMEILKSSGYSELDTLVMETMQEWKWEPGNKTTPERIIVFRFQLRTGDT